MPCEDDWLDEELAERSMLSASLCAILSTIEDQTVLKSFFDRIDWMEAGVARGELERWWKEHKAEDARRRKAEAKRRKRAEERGQSQLARETALAKLTAAERKLLGVRA